MQPSEHSTFFGKVSELTNLRAALRAYFRLPEIDIPPEENTTVVLLAGGTDKFAVVKLVRDLAKLPLSEAKALVDSAPCRIPVEDVTRARSMFRDAGAEIEDPPNREWLCYPLDSSFMKEVPELTLASGFRLLMQARRTEHGANGSVCAIPAEMLPAVLSSSAMLGDRPLTARPVPEILSGDGSPESYLKSSILIREIYEAGSEWHGVEWAAHELVDRPGQNLIRVANWRGKLRLGKLLPIDIDDYAPRVVTLEDQVIVIYFTESRLGRHAMYCHADRYKPGKYQPKCERTRCGIGGQGYVH